MDKAEKFKKKNADEKEVQSRDTADGKKEYLDEETNEWVSKNELKKRNTQRKKAKEAAEKAAKKPAPAKKEKADAVNEDDLDPSKYTELRRRFIQSLRDANQNPYPHKFNRELSIKEFREKYEATKIADGEFLESTKVAIVGRIMQSRNQG